MTTPKRGRPFSKPQSAKTSRVSKSPQLDASGPVNSKQSVGPDEFPYFNQGTIIVKLSAAAGDHYRLHRATLMRNSSWFAKEIQYIDTLPDAPQGNYVFILCRSENENLPPRLIWRGPQDKLIGAKPRENSMDTDLTRPKTTSLSSAATGNPDYSSTNNISPPSTSSSASNPASSSLVDSVLVAKNAENDSAAISTDLELCLFTYRKFLGIMYSQEPQLSSNVLEALGECEALMGLASMYGSEMIVRPMLISRLGEFRLGLYKGIATDPPRWMNLAVRLQSGMIFSEALVHCAGGYPDFPWPTKLASVLPECYQIVFDKSRSLQFKRIEIDNALFTNTLLQSDGRPATLVDSPEAWLVNSVFHDWLRRECLNATISHKWRAIGCYRLIHQGGDAYLPEDEVEETLIEVDAPGVGQWEELGQELKTIKNYAKSEVAPLVKSELLIDAENEGIPYLTCVGVSESEYPWNRSQRLR